MIDGPRTHRGWYRRIGIEIGIRNHWSGFPKPRALRVDRLGHAPLSVGGILHMHMYVLLLLSLLLLLL